MRRSRLVLLIVIIAAGGGYWWKFHYMADKNDDQLSTIDKIIGRTQSGDVTSGATNIDLDSDASNEQQYAGGGEYQKYAEIEVSAALQLGKRVIIVFERSGDPTSVVLHDDIVARSARIPKNAKIFFANVDAEPKLTNAFSIERPNTILYLGTKGQEIRRKGNGIVSLAQIVNGIDNLE